MNSEKKKKNYKDKYKKNRDNRPLHLHAMQLTESIRFIFMGETLINLIINN